MDGIADRTFVITRRVPGSRRILRLQLEAPTLTEAKRDADEIQYACGFVLGAFDEPHRKRPDEWAEREALKLVGTKQAPRFDLDRRLADYLQAALRRPNDAVKVSRWIAQAAA